MASSFKHSGKVLTVLGPVDPQSLGKTLMHEHIIWNYALRYKSRNPESCWTPIGGLSHEEQRELWDAPLSLKNLGHVRRYFNQNKDNLILDDIPTMTSELQDFKKFGGGAIVELSCKDTASNPLALKTISQLSGVHIVCSSSYYTSAFHPPDMTDRSLEQLAEEFIADVNEGYKESGIHAGILGELGCSTDLHANEVKVLKAAARAQKKTGAAISIHPGLSREAPMEILDILEAEGAELSRVVMGHVDRGLLTFHDLLELTRRKCILGFDFFGSNFSFVMESLVDFPSDFERCKIIRKLCDEGFIGQVVVSQDLCVKSSLKSYGGAGFSYILQSIVPYMMRIGFTKEEIDRILIDNPRDILTVP